MSSRARIPSPGFTLFEVTVVLLVLAIVAGLAAPMLGQTNVTRLAEAAKLLEADLAYAQIESITHADDPRVVTLTTGTATPGYFIAAASSVNVDGTLKTGKSPITNPVGGGSYRTTFGRGRAAALDGVHIVSVAPAPVLRFGVYGQLCTAASATANHGTDAVITLGCDDLRVTLTVDDVTGDVTIGHVN